MFCRNCGSPMADNSFACMSCGVQRGVGNNFCPHCGAQTNPQAVICVRCGIQLNSVRHQGDSLNGAVRDFTDAIKICFEKYADFDGRANRAEYWYFYLFAVIVSNIPIIGYIASLALLIPSLAVTVRRLHDIGKSGLWALLYLLPIVGWIWILVLNAQAGERGANQYGPDPNC